MSWRLIPAIWQRLPHFVSLFTLTDPGMDTRVAIPLPDHNRTAKNCTDSRDEMVQCPRHAMQDADAPASASSLSLLGHSPMQDRYFYAMQSSGEQQMHNISCRRRNRSLLATSLASLILLLAGAIAAVSAPCLMVFGCFAEPGCARCAARWSKLQAYPC